MKAIKLETDNPSDLHSITQMLTQINVDIATIHATPESLTITGMDGSHITYYNIEITPEFFTTYKVPEEEEIIIPVEELNNILKLTRREDTITITNKTDDEENTTSLIITRSTEKGETRFTIPCPDTEYATPTAQIDTFQLNATLTVNTDIITSFFKDAALTSSESIYIKVDEDYLHLKTCNDYNPFQVIFRHVHGERVDGEYLSRFTIEKLKPLILPRFETVTIHIDNKKPIRLEYSSNGVKANLLLAPRIIGE